MHFIRDNLAVSGFLDAGRREEFEAHGFTAQLQCAEPFDPWLRECVEVKSLPFDDGLPVPRGLFQEAQAWLAGHWDAGSRILISCAAGRSRSVTMSMALLSLKSAASFLDAAHQVMARVPGAYPHPQVLVSAAAYCGYPLQIHELARVYSSIPSPPPYPWPMDLLQEALSGAQAKYGDGAGEG